MFLSFPCNIGDKLFNIGFAIIKKDCQQKFVWLDSIWVFPKMVVSPKHPKMMIFSRKTHGFVGETHHLRKPQYEPLPKPTRFST